MSLLVANPDGTTPNPVTMPAKGTQDAVPVREAYAGELRDPLPAQDPPEVMPRLLAIVPNVPPALCIPAQPNRAPRKPGGAWALFSRIVRPEWAQDSPGTHAEVSAAIQPPSGRMAGWQNRGNTYRLPPEPADTQLYIGVVPGYGAT
jgi:hypothetical protein